MALVPCPDCRKEISDRAAACPGCGAPSASSTRAKRAAVLAVAGVLAVVTVGAAIFVLPHKPDYSKVEELRADQDEHGTRSEHIRQRFFRLFSEHPDDAMYAYLWARCVDDPKRQLEIAEQGVRVDPKFAWNYNLVARGLASQGRIADAFASAEKGAALDPANLLLADHRDVLKLILDHKLGDEPRPAAGPSVHYRGVYRGPLRSPDRGDFQAIERARLPDHKGPVADDVRGFTVCSNPYADACIRAYVAVDARLGAAWPRPAIDVSTLKDNQTVLALTGAVVDTGRGEHILLADTVAMEP